MQYCASGLILFENKQGHWHCSTSIVDTSAVITPAPPYCCCWRPSPPRTHSRAAPRSPPAPPRSPTPRRATGSRRSPATRPRSSCWTATSSPPTPTCASRCAAGGHSRWRLQQYCLGASVLTVTVSRGSWCGRRASPRAGWGRGTCRTWRTPPTPPSPATSTAATRCSQPSHTAGRPGTA